MCRPLQSVTSRRPQGSLQWRWSFQFTGTKTQIWTRDLGSDWKNEIANSGFFSGVAGFRDRLMNSDIQSGAWSKAAGPLAPKRADWGGSGIGSRSSRALPFGGFSRAQPTMRSPPGQTQNLLEGWHMSSGLGMPQDPPQEDLESVAGEREVWDTLLSLLLYCNLTLDKHKENGLLAGWLDR